MNQDLKWRFLSNGNGPEIGLSDSNSEMFKKDPVASLAREVVQNSIDARYDYKKPVRVEFQCFDVTRDDIPNIDQIENHLIDAIETWQNSNPEMIEKLNDMLAATQALTIHCCRISDFNTRGLEGVQTEDEHKRKSWHDLIYTSGASGKTDTSGGSKGVGKYAAYVNSELGTVFYSTLTCEGQTGYIGLSKTCSAIIKDDPDGAKTIDISYFCGDKSNSSIAGQFALDKKYRRKESGTDLYIIGFIDNAKWIEEVIAKLLDSFMCAIYFNTLVLEVDKYRISKDNLSDYVFNPEIIDPTTALGKSIIMQYNLLTKCDVPYEIELEGYGSAKLYFLDCSGEEYDEYRLSKSYCTMVRAPYMKICDQPIGIGLPFAALCIIENTDFITDLKVTENPQHTAWEFGRLNQKPEQKKKVKGAYDKLVDEITSYIKAKLFSSDARSSELVGAGQFIPLIEDDNGTKTKTTGDNRILKAKATLTNKKVVIKNVDVDAQFEDENGNGLQFDYAGNDASDVEDAFIPDEYNEGNGGFLRINNNSGQSSSVGEDNIVARMAPLRSMQYRFACVDRRKGKWAVIFDSDVNEKKATLELYEVDENYDVEQVEIVSAEVNGEKAKVTNKKVVNLSLEKGKRTTVYLDTNRKELFSAEVRVYAYRK